MNGKLFSAVLLAAGIAVPQKRYVTVVAKPTKTRNLFGPIEEVAGKTLEVVNMNPHGDALCLFKGRAGVNLVDVDHVDVEPKPSMTGREEMPMPDPRQIPGTVDAPVRLHRCTGCGRIFESRVASRLHFCFSDRWPLKAEIVTVEANQKQPNTELNRSGGTTVPR